MIQIAGGDRRPVTLRAPDFRFFDQHRRAARRGSPDPDPLRPAQRPHNPTGTVLTRDELTAVAEVATAHDVVVITDEVYEHLTFTGDDGAHDHIPLATVPGMPSAPLTLSSAGKSYSFTGWKVGWAPGRPNLSPPVLAAKQWSRRSPRARRFSRPWPPRSTSTRTSPGSRGRAGRSSSATCSAPAWRRSGWRAGHQGDRLRDDRHLRCRLARRSLCLRRPSGRGRRVIPTQVFYDDSEAGRRGGSLGVLQGARRHRGGPGPARGRRPGVRLSRSVSSGGGGRTSRRRRR